MVGVVAIVVAVMLAWWLRRATVVAIWLWLAVEAIVVVVMVAWLALWLRGSDVGCCNGGRDMVDPK